MSDNGKNAALTVGAGLAGYGLGKMGSKVEASSAPDNEIVQLLRDIRDGIANIQFPESGGGSTPSVSVNIPQLKNFNTILSFTCYTTGALVAKQLPRYTVPDNVELVIKALPTNLGYIFVSNSQSNAQESNQSYWLIANEGIGYKVDYADSIWIASTVATEGVVCTVEQRGE
jgi:hypothetical protein